MWRKEQRRIPMVISRFEVASGRRLAARLFTDRQFRDLQPGGKPIQHRAAP
jgi:hypothetical protein